jgi:ribosomal protein S18 acetylase RimI-like enzyme
MKLTFRKAERKDLIQIAKLIRSGFLPKYIEMMVWGCRGAEKYLADLIDVDSTLCDVANYVGIIDDEIIAVTQLKRNLSNRTLHLNYICTDQAYRKNNVGSKLMLHSITEESSIFEHMALDVFLDNYIANRWYSSLGFNALETREWLVISTEILDSRVGYVSGLPQSNCCFEEYGFSQFMLSTDKGNYSIGILGENYYRIADVRIIEDLVAISTLAKLSPNRQILLIAENQPIKDVQVNINKVAATVHMSTGIKNLIGNIKKSLIN